MFRMEIDSPPLGANTPSPRYRIVERLAQFGVPEENLEHLQSGLVAYAKYSKLRIPELVSAILPTDDEAVEAVLEAQAEANLGVSIEDQFCESMVWLQWLMFEGEPGAALKQLAKMNIDQRGVCGAVWGNNDIAYRCRTCAHDPTCAICVPCFQNGNHKDHDYSIIYTGSGCCDCGDATAWKREGFCSKHKGAEQMQTLPEKFAYSVGPVLDSLLLYWKNKMLLTETVHHDSRGAYNHVAELKKVVGELTSAVVEMLLEFCNCSESLLSFISGRVLACVGLLEILVRAERFLNDDIIRKLHELLLKLLGEPQFKYEFAKAFLSYYPSVVSEVIKESNDAIFRKNPLLSTFSVQIFTVPTLTPRLVKEKNLLTTLLECLGDIFVNCAGEDGQLQVNKWGNLYETTLRVVEDIRFVLSHSVVPRYVTRDRQDISRTWMRLLAFVQGMSPLKREIGIHIDEENENMHLPFVLGLSIANINSLLVGGAFSVGDGDDTDEETFLNTRKQDFEDQDSLRHAKVGRLSEESSVTSVTGRNSPLDSASKAVDVKCDASLIPPSVSWLMFECLRATENSLGMDITSGPLPSVLSPKTSAVSVNNFFAFKRTLSKIKKGRNIFKPHNLHSSDIKLASSSDVHSKRCISSANGHFHTGIDLESGQSVVQDTVSATFDENVVEGEYATVIEALRVLSLSDWPEIMYDVSSQGISVHIPLHRLLALVLQRALRRCYGDSASPSSAEPLAAIYNDFFGYILGGCHPYGFSAFIMEYPLRIRVFCAEVHAGMWRKNGDAAILSCEYYRSVRWCEQGLELDLFLLQCCAALAPADLYVNRILERFGLSNYLALNLERSSEYEPVLVQEMLILIIQIVKERRFCGLTTSQCLQRELIYKLSLGDATHSQLVKSLPRNLSKVEKLQEILDTIAVYSHPSGMKQGTYRLRLEYWNELDLYHPRWNSRDLQVAEERYLRFCNASALTNQLPKWTKICHPLHGIARIATCKMAFQIVRAVAFYAVFADKLAASRAPDGVLLTALHLLSLALDICFWQRESGDRSSYMVDLIPILAFAGEEICTELANSYGRESLLSLLVSLMRIHKRENPGNFIEAGNFNLSPLIENLLKKFAELDSGCMIKLQQLAPEVVDQLSKVILNGDTDIMVSASDGDKRKAKTRERQAAILEKMRVQQSKFLASINSTADDGLDSSDFEKEVCPSDVCRDAEESAQVICSLCHDPSSKNPVSFLILLQKSRLLSFVDQGPPSWEQGNRSEKVQTSISTNSLNVPSRDSSVSSSSEMISSSQLMHFIQNAVNEFASDGQPWEVNAFLEFIKGRFPLVRNLQLPCTSNGTREKNKPSFETLEEHMYLMIQEGMHDNLLCSNVVKNDKFSTAGGLTSGQDVESHLLGKYISVLSRETIDYPSASENVRPSNDKAQSRSTASVPSWDGFGPSDCDGIHVSSCGHAVHQGCLDRYLSSLKERYIRRIVFEGGHIVDPDQGEFLCPVCRGLTNSVLPALLGDYKKVFKPPMRSAGGISDEAIGSLRLQQALSLLESAADVTGRSQILEAFPTQRNGRMNPNLDSVYQVLCGMYFPGKDKISGSGRVNQSMIMWDTFKYSLISTEIAARSSKTSLMPDYGLSALYKELKSSSGFILSLLLKIVQSTRSRNSLSVLLRMRGIQLFSQSICFGASSDAFQSGGCMQGDSMLCILENSEVGVQYPDIQFWKRVSDPVLAHDAFSSLMWILFCLPHPFLSCGETFLSLVHMFYVVSITQAIITYCGKRQCNMTELGYSNCLITEICKMMGQCGIAQQYFVSNFIELSSDLKDIIWSLSFPYLRRCALLWKIINSSTSAPFVDNAHVLDSASYADDRMACASGFLEIELEELEKMFKIPSVDDIINDETLHSVVSKWLLHYSKQVATQSQCLLHSTPVTPFKLMSLPHLYQDLLQRYIKQCCPDCGGVKEDPALCLLCGRLCSRNWKTCCRESCCQTHAMACGAGTGVFLLIRKTTILLQRSARQAPWPSPYLDAFGEEDIEMQRGKPLYLNEERYAALTHMVASHGLDRSSKVLRQTTIGSFFML